MRQFRGRRDWTRLGQRPRVSDQQYEIDQAEQRGRQAEIDKEEACVIACLDDAPADARAFVPDLRKVGAWLSDAGLSQLAAYATPVWLVPHAGGAPKLMMACIGWDHRERAIEWAEVFNQLRDEQAPETRSNSQP